MSIISFISASTAAIFSADVGWGRPNPRKDIVARLLDDGRKYRRWSFSRDVKFAVDAVQLSRPKIEFNFRAQ